RLAENIQQALMEVVDKSNNRSAKGSGKSIFVLRDNIIPSVLVECGFLSNTEEAKKLADTEYQRKLAWGIYTGIVRYFSE
ncbi:MAG: N-acetylmuramoyl-L-alanine amidase, partial [Clostridia bacterium]|nr:N-acetylmuramoyl-L-alanine amidase [Clostridia bacterium]